MVQSGFLNEEDRKGLMALARDESLPSRVMRRANALVLLEAGRSCWQVAAAPLLDHDTVRGFHKLFEHRGIEGLTRLDVGGSASYLNASQEDDLKAWVAAVPPRSARQIGAWISQEFGLIYESRWGLVALLSCITNVTHADESRTQCTIFLAQFFGTISCARKVPKTGDNSAIQSPIISASSCQGIFAF